MSLPTKLFRVKVICWLFLLLWSIINPFKHPYNFFLTKNYERPCKIPCYVSLMHQHINLWTMEVGLVSSGWGCPHWVLWPALLFLEAYLRFGQIQFYIKLRFLSNLIFSSEIQLSNLLVYLLFFSFPEIITCSSPSNYCNYYCPTLK